MTPEEGEKIIRRIASLRDDFARRRSYHISTIHDFAKVPEDRRDVCLHEFRVFVDLVEATQKLLGDLVEAPMEFLWVDDDQHTATVLVEGEGERIEVASGRMKGDWT